MTVSHGVRRTAIAFAVILAMTLAGVALALAATSGGPARADVPLPTPSPSLSTDLPLPVSTDVPLPTASPSPSPSPSGTSSSPTPSPSGSATSSSGSSSSSNTSGTQGGGGTLTGTTRTSSIAGTGVRAPKVALALPKVSLGRSGFVGSRSYAMLRSIGEIPQISGMVVGGPTSAWRSPLVAGVPQLAESGAAALQQSQSAAGTTRVRTAANSVRARDVSVGVPGVVFILLLIAGAYRLLRSRRFRRSGAAA